MMPPPMTITLACSGGVLLLERTGSDEENARSRSRLRVWSIAANGMRRLRLEEVDTKSMMMRHAWQCDCVYDILFLPAKNNRH